jgi:endonuclease YncB( thermonuclease family)
LIFFGLSLFFTVKVAAFKKELSRSSLDVTVNSGDEVLVTHIIDGDEISVKTASQQFIVRILGIYAYDPTANDPAAQNAARSAFDYLRKHLLHHKITIVFDEFKKDSKNRVLAYVHRSDRDLGMEMVEMGHVLVYTLHPFSRQKDYLLSEAKARRDGVGVWSGSVLSNRSLLLKNMWENESREQ